MIIEHFQVNAMFSISGRVEYSMHMVKGALYSPPSYEYTKADITYCAYIVSNSETIEDPAVWAYVVAEAKRLIQDYAEHDE